MAMKGQFDGSADLMMNMVGAMVIMLALFVPLAQLEQITFLDNQTDQENTRSSELQGLESALVEIGLGQDPDSLVIRWKGSDQAEAVSLNNQQALIEAMQRERPDAIRLRMDRQVPSGVMQDLVVAASDLGITILQSNRLGQSNDG